MKPGTVTEARLSIVSLFDSVNTTAIQFADRPLCLCGGGGVVVRDIKTTVYTGDETSIESVQGLS